MKIKRNIMEMVSSDLCSFSIFKALDISNRYTYI